MNIKKLKYLPLLLCTVLMCTALYGCGKKEEKPTLNFINYGDNIADGLLEEFEEQYGIHVVQDFYDSPEEMYQRVTAGAIQYDVVVSGNYTTERMILEDRLEKINYDNVPNMENIHEDHLNQDFDINNEYSVPYMSGTIGICYNTDYVDEPIDSWLSLWDEKYQKNVMILDSMRDSLGAALKLSGYSLNTTNPDELKQAADKLIELKQNGNLLSMGINDNTNKMAAGEAAISILWSGEALNMQEENPSIKFVVPKEGANFWIDSLCIPKGTNNKENAEKFINFLCEKDSAFRTAAQIGYTTPNKVAREEQDDSIKNNPNAYMNEELMGRCENYNYLGSELSLYDNAWTDFKNYKK